MYQEGPESSAQSRFLTNTSLKSSPEDEYYARQTHQLNFI